MNDSEALIQYHIQREEGIKQFLAFDRHSDTNECFWAEWESPFILRFDSENEASGAMCRQGALCPRSVVRLSVDGRLATLTPLSTDGDRG